MTRPVPPKVFGSDYDDPRDARPGIRSEREKERTEVVKQARHLAALRNDPDHRARVIALLQVRREQRPDLVEFETVDNDGFEALVVPGELVVRRGDIDTQPVQDLIAKFDLERRNDDESTSLVRLVERGLDHTKERLRGRMGRLVDEIRANKATGSAAPAYICPLGAVIKGEGGPEPSTGARQRPPAAMQVVGAVPVAVIDTGISDEERTDGWLQNLLGADNEDELDVIPAKDGSLDLGAGHGTFAAGVVQQVAPHADLRVLRAMDSDGIGTDAQVAEMMVRAVEDGAKIVNLSLGTQTLDDEGPLALRVALEKIIQLDREVLVIAAAGNYGDTRECWPAAFSQEFHENVIAVAGLTPTGIGAPWSSHGGWVTCSAVGEGVVSTYVIGTENKLVDDPPDTFKANSWASWTGTSFAAPQIAGAVARKMAEDGSTPRKAMDDLLALGVDLIGFGKAMIILPGT